jgi:hypothetical protein
VGQVRVTEGRKAVETGKPLDYPVAYSSEMPGMLLKYSIFFSLAFFSHRPKSAPNTPLTIKKSAIHIGSDRFMRYSSMI